MKRIAPIAVLILLLTPLIALAQLPVSGAQVWLKADAGVLDATDVAASDSEDIKTWQDQSGNSHHAVQATVSKQPTFIASSLNGMPGVYFPDTAGEVLESPYSGEARTIFVVGEVDDNTQIRGWCGGRGPLADGLTDDAWYFQPRGLSLGNTFIRTNAAGSASDFRASRPLSTGVAAKLPYVQFGRHDDATIELGDNGFIKATDTTASGLMPTGTSVAIGAVYFNEVVVDHLKGTIYEVVIFDRKLTEDEVDLMYRYLNRWFGGATIASAPIVSASWLSDAGGATDPGQALYIGTSTDATTYTDSLAAQWVPDGNVVRDPSLIKNPDDGYWYICYTIEHWSINSTSFGVLKSKDGRLWTHVTNVDMSSVAGLDFTFAPEFFLDDDGLHVIVGLSTAGSVFTMYETHPTNADLTTWSAPVPLTGAGLTANSLDGMVRKVNGIYEMWYTDRTSSPWSNVRVTAASLTGPWIADTDFTGTWQGMSSEVEGPYLMSLGGKILRLHFDQINGGLGQGQYTESVDNGATWSASTVLTRTAKRHGSFINQSFVDPRVTGLDALTPTDIDAITAAVWDRLVADLTTTSSVGELVATNLDATVSSRSTFNGAVDTVDVGRISGDAVAADNLEAMLDNTGGTLRLKAAGVSPGLLIGSSLSAPALQITAHEQFGTALSITAGEAFSTAVFVSAPETNSRALFITANNTGSDAVLLQSADGRGVSGLMVDTDQISGDATAANNLEALLDGTGGVNLDLANINAQQVNITQTTPAQNAVNITANAAGSSGVAINTTDPTGTGIQLNTGGGTIDLDGTDLKTQLGSIDSAITTIDANVDTAIADIDGVTRAKFMEILLASAAGTTSLTDNGNGTSTLRFFKQNGTTPLLDVTFNGNGEWTATVIDPAP